MSVFKVFFHRKAMKNLYKLPKNVLGRMYVLFNDLGTIQFLGRLGISKV